MKEVKSQKLRLDRFLSTQNVATRKEAVKLIRRGAVSVDGEILKDPGVHIDTGTCKVKVEGVPVVYQQYIYLMMNKPAGVLSASRDRHAKTVLDLLPDENMRRGLFPAGRLDKDTTGLMIITDDGGYSHKMLHPKKNVYKLYRAKLFSEMTEEYIRKFQQGVSYKGIDYASAILEIEDDHHAFIQIREGKYHQVKLMFEACGNHVEKLERLRIGALKLDERLEIGEARPMTEQEAMLVFI